MEKSNQEFCQCEKAPCGCADAKLEGCGCGDNCDCARSCNCPGGCDCAAAK